jgi:hypothetical protein
MMPIRLAYASNALQRVLITDMTAERIAGVGWVRDNPARTQQICRLLDEATLRVLGVKVKALHATSMIPA